MIVVVLASVSLVSAEEKKAPSVDGSWKWTYKTKDGKDAEALIKLKQDGEKLTGSYVARDGTETPIQHGKIKGDELSFDVNREVGDQKMLFKYSGKLEGDTITGKIVFGREKPLPHEWEAKRVKA
jgi:D-glucosaminate-6-phosphate ammonia-lyase